MTENKINLAVVGCGRISNWHFNAIKEHKNDINLVAICDINKERVDEAAEKLGVKAYYDMDDMLKNEKLDAVTLATPNGLHAKQGIKVASYGVNVITEKPLAVKYQDGVDLVNACKKNSVRSFIIYQNRYNKTVSYIKKLIDDGKFGKIYMMLANVLWYKTEDYYTSIPWHGTKDIDGGVYMTQASHASDIMHWFSGSKIKSVYSHLNTFKMNIETEDAGSAIINWENGIIGNINATVLAYNRNIEGSVTVIAEKGFVKIGGKALNKIETLNLEGYDDNGSSKLISELNYDTESVYGFGHTPAYSDIVSSIKTGKEHFLTMEAALESLEMLSAVLKSSEDKKIVNLPLK